MPGLDRSRILIKQPLGFPASLVLPSPSSHNYQAGSPAMSALFNGPLAQARRDQAVSDSSSLQAWVMAFNILSALGFILLAVILFTALLSPNVRRVSTWYSYIVAWIFFCITPFLVIGHQMPSDPPPSFAPCVLDEALMYASRPFAAFGTLSLILQLYLNVSTRLKRGEVRPEFVFVLLAIPPILYLIVFLWTFILGIVNPDQVELEPKGFYCHLNQPSPSIVVACLVLFATSAALVIEGMIVILLSRNWRAFRALQRRDEHTVSLSIIIRVSVFAILPMIGLGLSFTTYVPNLVDKIFPAYNLVLASLPTAAALIFGSQSDIIQVWMFWKVEGKTMTQLSLTTVDSSSCSINSA
ncbi:hypothetical protein MVEN_01753400 [Mycena venus]|uniref:Uncharacterized protein n=1 Tax=Mycena venus TaxID=2733690 RepID=A0A8H6XMP7_9AGAR|nr:hypothetical protein MVEN_01753400 [Mycena venus]